MIKNYIITAVRNLKNNKGVALINVLCLSLGIMSALIIAKLVTFELSFDRFHSNADNTYRLVRVSKVEGKDEFRSGVSIPLPSAIRQEVPGIKMVTSTFYLSGAQVTVVGKNGKADRYREEKGVTLADSTFFKVFDFQGTRFKWLAGDKKTALANPYSIVLTKSLAKKYFSTEDAIGKTLQLRGPIDCKITGVIEDLPDNSDFPFTLFLSYPTVKVLLGNLVDRFDAQFDNHNSFIVLSEKSDLASIENQITKINIGRIRQDWANSIAFKLQPLSELHTNANFGNFNNRTVSKERISILVLIGVFLLIVACINYVNLTTAQALNRSKEVGIRKTLGGSIRQLVSQHIIETVILTIIAAVVGLAVATTCLPYLAENLGMNMTDLSLFTPELLLATGAIVLLTTVLAGLYPALIASRFSALEAIKTKITSTGSQRAPARKILVTFQLAITQCLLIAAFVVMMQMNFFTNSNLGFDSENIVNVNLPGGDLSKLKLLEERLLTHPAISQVSFSSSLPSGINRASLNRDIKTLEAQPTDAIIYEYQSIDPHYLELYSIPITAGRNFWETDSTDKVIVTEGLAKRLGITPESIIGSQLDIGTGTGLATVIGVTNDFHKESLKSEKGKVGFVNNPVEYSTLSIKLTSSKDKNWLSETEKAIQHIKSSWEGIYLESIFSFQFFDDNIQEFYKEEMKFSSLTKIFSLVFLVIGCLGLHGLISFIIHKKAREISIRKVFGAVPLQIFNSIVKDHLQLVLIAFLMAAPVAYILMQKWLDGFAYHIEIQYWIVLAPGVVMAITTLLAISYHLIKAARINPAQVLNSH